jgi:hypothetical protein
MGASKLTYSRQCRQVDDFSTLKSKIRGRRQAAQWFIYILVTEVAMLIRYCSCRLPQQNQSHPAPAQALSIFAQSYPSFENLHKLSHRQQSSTTAQHGRPTVSNHYITITTQPIRPILDSQDPRQLAHQNPTPALNIRDRYPGRYRNHRLPMSALRPDGQHRHPRAQPLIRYQRL